MTDALTHGVHHVGLAVRDLDEATSFFCGTLGFKEVGRNDAYPAVFVSDGSVTLTIWRVTDPSNAVAFNRKTNIGLHHLALAVADRGGARYGPRARSQPSRRRGRVRAGACPRGLDHTSLHLRHTRRHSDRVRDAPELTLDNGRKARRLKPSHEPGRFRASRPPAARSLRAAQSARPNVDEPSPRSRRAPCGASRSERAALGRRRSQAG